MKQNFTKPSWVSSLFTFLCKYNKSLFSCQCVPEYKQFTSGRVRTFSSVYNTTILFNKGCYSASRVCRAICQKYCEFNFCDHFITTLKITTRIFKLKLLMFDGLLMILPSRIFQSWLTIKLFGMSVPVPLFWT